jgi:2-keto-4-pentenoate hydratase/2-oxohepta-3-ene-1,7-dioic acid hydratase in catechol pathway
MAAEAIERAWRKRFGRTEPSLQAGDEVEIEVEEIGVLRNPVVAEE